MGVVDANVLVLNLDFQPLNVCNVRRAVVLLAKEKASVVEQNGHLVTSERLTFPSPCVLRPLRSISTPLTYARASSRGPSSSAWTKAPSRPSTRLAPYLAAMKLLFTKRAYARVGGSESLAYQFATRLASRGHDVRVVC